MGRRFIVAIMLWFVSGLVISQGCGSRTRGNIPQTAPVSGIVTLDGQPVDGATVVFVPTGTPAYGAYAVTDSKGRFVLKSSETVSGAVPGKYFVQVTKLVTDTTGKQYVVAEDAEHAALASGDTTPTGTGGITRNVLPEKYANPKTSGIEVTVPPEGLQDFEIKLSSQ
ncbi:MAG: carboxypeptidase regulatory-like domain-containing protein [Thermogutta sp.]|uniref:carboxypeptidase-like regulatory domain-containing protein n=1 Tax=Thermogutta sp. TaxID=1962930 RepID=UPI0019B928AD|nr:carboxypeptidase-like regulatory domain-containing protein [Thermogutta sp.]MBC7351982.1 carboxypeptidase regulatory-like domain-containing protein [Thermogutta sp.]